jgi:2-keto-3-deoxy-L-rhamnonate aldolase RhmA
MVGTVVTLPDVALAELTASFFDFVWIDLEHGALDAADVQPLAVAARAAGAACFVRVPAPGDSALGRALDAGVEGVVVPRVERAADAARAVERLHHPPRGSRGTAARRASAYGLAGTTGEAPSCVIQIESAAGVEAAGELAGVEGVDALVVGCADLALSLGEPAVSASPRLREAVAAVQLAAADAGIESGVAGPDDPELLSRLAGGRADMLVLGADVRLYARALDTAARRLRAAPEREEAHVGA